MADFRASAARFVPLGPAPPQTTANTLERCATALMDVAFDFRIPAKDIAMVERRIAEVERICADARRAVRG